MKTFEEWFEQYCKECDRKLTAMDYINYTNHEWYFKTGWNARQPEIDELKECIDKLLSIATYTYSNSATQKAVQERMVNLIKVGQNCLNKTKSN